MKIYFDGVIELLQKNGGCTVYFRELLTNINSKHSDCSLFSYINFVGDKSYIGFDLGDSFNIKNINYLRFAERWRDVNVGNEGGEFIFHSTHYRLPQRKPKNVKVVSTVHDFTYELYRNGPAKWMHSWQKFRAIRNSDIVICVSQNTADDLMKYCPIDPSKIRVVYNGVSAEYFPIGAVEKTNEVIFIGARSWYKNFSLAIETLMSQPELMLSIVGGGALSKDEKNLLDSSIPGRYRWLGRLTDKELNQVYNRAYCLFYPSSYEGFGIPVIEAMRAGCPVIAVGVSSIPEVAGDAALLTKNADVLSFNEAFIRLRDTEFRSNLIQKGFLQSSKFSWEKCYSDTLEVYKELGFNFM